jgi:hypothetical protein
MLDEEIKRQLAKVGFEVEGEECQRKISITIR